MKSRKAFYVFRLLIAAINSFIAKCRTFARYTFNYFKERVVKAFKLMSVLARGVYSFITPIIRPAGLALAITVITFTGFCG